MKKLIYTIACTTTVMAILATGCASTTPTTPTAPVTSQAPGATTEKTFTLEELKKFNGQNGNPAYVAIAGVVYDVTNNKSWNAGKHKGQVAGNDLTSVLKSSSHGDAVLKKLPIVGKLAK